MASKTKICYACGIADVPLSREHVPPKSLHPLEMRREMMTVWSCSIHNQGKSADDEYLLCLAPNLYHSNQVGIEHGLRWLARVQKSRPGHAERTVGPIKDILVHRTEGTTEPAALILFDAPRIEGALELMARGVFFKTYGECAPANTAVAMDFSLSDQAHDRNLRSAMFDRGRDILGEAVYRGSNPDVFQYRTHRHVNGPIVAAVVEICLYGGNHAIVAFSDGHQ